MLVIYFSEQDHSHISIIYGHLNEDHHPGSLRKMFCIQRKNVHHMSLWMNLFPARPSQVECYSILLLALFSKSLRRKKCGKSIQKGEKRWHGSQMNFGVNEWLRSDGHIPLAHFRFGLDFIGFCDAYCKERDLGFFFPRLFSRVPKLITFAWWWVKAYFYRCCQCSSDINVLVV